MRMAFQCIFPTGGFRDRAAIPAEQAARLWRPYAEMSDFVKYTHTGRPGFLLGCIDFVTAGLFFLIYMKAGLQDELEAVLGHRVMPYWKAYLLGIPTLFLYTLIWMARISEELKEKAEEMGIPGPHTSWRHMFGWNVYGLLLMGPAVATHRFFRTLDRVEAELNRRAGF